MQITLKAARVNVDLSQQEVVDILRDKYSITLSRQRLADYENDSSNLPIKLASYLEEIYFLNRENIFFGHKSTLSYTNRFKQTI